MHFAIEERFREIVEEVIDEGERSESRIAFGRGMMRDCVEDL